VGCIQAGLVATHHRSVESGRVFHDYNDADSTTKYARAELVTAFQGEQDLQRRPLRRWI
jgi:hypothetical protein